jgi:hypothetical protein
VQFADSATRVTRLRVWVDRQLPQDLAGQYAWTAWRSDDNATWVRIDVLGTVPFDPFEPRFDLDVTPTEARYVKAADAPITMIAYESLVCPHFAAFHVGALPVLKEKYVDKGVLKNLFRELPGSRDNPFPAIPAMMARYASAIAMWLLPTPLGPSSTTFSARSMKVRAASSWICALGAPLAKAKSYCSSVFTAGNVASLSSVWRVRSTRALASALRSFSRKSA